MIIVQEAGLAACGVQLGFLALFGVICAIIAANRGRSAVGWFFIGCFAGCIGLILVLVLPDLKVQEQRDRRTLLENRKLREQLKKERQVADKRQENVEQRLGTHDEALGLDTSTPPQLTGTASAAQLTEGDQWFYALNGKRQGPVSSETIRHLLQAQAIDGETLAWATGMDDWVALDDIDFFHGDNT